MTKKDQRNLQSQHQNPTELIVKKQNKTMNFFIRLLISQNIKFSGYLSHNHYFNNSNKMADESQILFHCSAGPTMLARTKSQVCSVVGSLLTNRQG